MSFAGVIIFSSEEGISRIARIRTPHSAGGARAPLAKIIYGVDRVDVKDGVVDLCRN